MMTPGSPPRLAEQLLRGLLGRRASAPFILADLREEFAGRNPHTATLWYWREALRIGLRLRLGRNPARTDPADLTVPPGDHMRLELRLAWRALSRRPLLAAAMILTIGLAIAAVTTVFAVVDGVLRRPLPYQEPDRLVAVWETNHERGLDENVISPANFLAWREQVRSFAGVAALVQFGAALTGDGEPEQVGVMQATADYFPLVGARPLLGRFYSAADDAPDAERVAVLSEGFWRRRYGGDPDVVGRTITLNGRATVIIGVMPAAADFAPRRAAFFSTGGRDLWLPARFPPEARTAGGRYLQVVARLAPGVSLEAARAEMNTLAAGSETQFPERQAGWGVTVRALKDDLVGEVRGSLVVLLAAVGLVLLVAGANVADLQLTRTVERQQEMAVRAALGAGRGRLLHQLLVEGLCIAAAGGVAGVLLARWAIGGLVASAPGLPRLDQVGLDLGVLGFAALVTAGCAIAFGLAPAAALGRGSLSGWLTHRASTARPGTQLARRVLVGAQVAFSFMLLVGAALLIRSMANRLGVDLGFRPGGVAVTDLSLPGSRFPEAADRQRFYEELIGRAAALPGVTLASAGSLLPMSGGGQATGFRALDRPAPAPGEEPVADVRFVHHDYHQALGIDLVQGRLLGEQDALEAPVAVLINEAGARQLWPGESAVGKRIEMEWGDTLNAEVVGVVRDVHLTGPDVPVDRTTLYWDYRQSGVPGAMSLIVRSSGDPRLLLPLIRQAARQQDPGIPLYNLRPMTDLLSQALAKSRFATMALALFAALALLLATIGLYGVIASATQQRTREIGIRMALGATGQTVRGMVLREGLAVVAPGIAVGALVSLALTGMLRAMVFEVSPGDPFTFVAVAAILTGTATLACWIPAHRASGVDPVEAIRSE